MKRLILLAILLLCATESKAALTPSTHNECDYVGAGSGNNTNGGGTSTPTTMNCPLTGVSAGSVIVAGVGYTSASAIPNVIVGCSTDVLVPMHNGHQSSQNGQWFYLPSSTSSGSISCTASWPSAVTDKVLFLQTINVTGATLLSLDTASFKEGTATVIATPNYSISDINSTDSEITYALVNHDNNITSHSQFIDGSNTGVVEVIPTSKMDVFYKPHAAPTPGPNTTSASATLNTTGNWAISTISIRQTLPLFGSTKKLCWDAVGFDTNGGAITPDSYYASVGSAHNNYNAGTKLLNNTNITTVGSLKCILLSDPSLGLSNGSNYLVVQSHDSSLGLSTYSGELSFSYVSGSTTTTTTTSTTTTTGVATTTTTTSSTTTTTIIEAITPSTLHCEAQDSVPTNSNTVSCGITGLHAGSLVVIGTGHSGRYANPLCTSGCTVVYDTPPTMTITDNIGSTYSKGPINHLAAFPSGGLPANYVNFQQHYRLTGSANAGTTYFTVTYSSNANAKTIMVREFTYTGTVSLDSTTISGTVRQLPPSGPDWPGDPNLLTGCFIASGGYSYVRSGTTYHIQNAYPYVPACYENYTAPTFTLSSGSNSYLVVGGVQKDANFDTITINGIAVDSFTQSFGGSGNQLNWYKIFSTPFTNGATVGEMHPVDAFLAENTIVFKGSGSPTTTTTSTTTTTTTSTTTTTRPPPGCNNVPGSRCKTHNRVGANDRKATHDTRTLLGTDRNQILSGRGRTQ